ncbi:UPF0434 protein YcaR [Candidatus Erwinia haradaeae]|uniref:UPF0434 protein ERCILAFE3058_566 n=1 Tax=Candidatus Erwinia haradaeae TaxID=1922217 RepID=A0A451DDF7_9GAMM|nr:Trm112 family protein [Candidatus Erwinia haradaeae]VFP84477.1 UPF0434 protein YcaR [Candidatus Erwinia haradaeae]
MHPLLLDLIACPICYKQLTLSHSTEKLELICHSDMVSYPIREGIPVLLTDKACPITST